MANDRLQAALRFRSDGMSVIPLEGKRPCVRWKPYQTKIASEETIRRWWKKWPQANVGIVTGELSGLIVLDIDSPEALEHAEREGLPLTWLSRTGRNGTGLHYYFKHPGLQVASPTNLGGIPGLDLKGDRALVTAPPSRHAETGRAYAWINPPKDTTLVGAPTWLLEAIRNQAAGGVVTKERQDKGNAFQRAQIGLHEGERNSGLTKVAGRCFSHGMPIEEVIVILLNLNQRCRPPLPSQEVHRIANSMERTHIRNSRRSQESTEFPAEMLTGLAGDFARLYGAHLESPLQYFFFTFLAGLGSILSRRLTTDSEISPQPRLYTVLLGESADTRKSTAIKKTIDFFSNAMEVDDLDLILSGAPSFEVSYGVGSAEGLQQRMKKDPALLLVYDEFRAFVSKSGIDGSVLLPMIVSLFESNVYENQTKKSRISLDDAHLSLLAACTVDTWHRIWKSSFTAIGLNNRLWLVPGMGNRRIAFPERVDSGARDNLLERTRQTIRHYAGREAIHVDDEARRWFQNWYNNLGTSLHTKRLDTYAHRLLPLLAANEGREVVDLEVVQKVLALCDWQLGVRQEYDPIDVDTLMARIEESIRRVLQKHDELTVKKLKDHTNARRHGIWYFDKALSNLTSAGEVRRFGKNKVTMV